MLRCLSSEQFEDLLTGDMDPVLQDLAEAHFDTCPRCHQTFLALTEVADAADWQAAAAVVSPTAEDDAFLAELRAIATQPLPPLGRAGRAVDASQWLTQDSLNGNRGRVTFHPPVPTKAPLVPGFEILGELGRGGMGVVYKARQIAHDRTVALKMILSGHHASVEDLGRFHDEAEAIARLRHPHIVQIFEVGRVDGRLYFVLEFVEGGTLADKVENRPLPARPAAQLAESLARAMHYAHERGIIHRDLKPANVLLHSRKAFLDIPEDVDRRPNDWDFRRFMPKITDFGLAKLLDRSAGHTASGDVVGTPSYMAPEQAQGKPYPIAATTDVYSLGAILYEMLTGKPPFLGPTPMDTLFQVHTQDPIPPRKVVRDVPAALETICLKCLRKDPGQRYQSADALAEDLRHFIEGQPIQARATNPLKQGWRSFRRHSGTLPAAALVLLTTVIAGGSILYNRWRIDPRPPAATGTTHGVQRDAAALRLRAALDHCERGATAEGLTELADLLADVDADPDLADLRPAVRGSLAQWSRQAPTLRAVLKGQATAVALTADGTTLLVAGPDRTLRRWDVAAGKFSLEAATLPAPADALSVSASGESVAVLSAGAVRWHKWTNFVAGPAAADAEKSLRAAAVAPDGAALLVAGGDGKVRLLDQTDRRELFALSADRLAWHPSGQAALFGGSDGTVTAAAAASGRWGPAHEWKHRSAVSGVAWARNGEVAVAAFADGFVFIRKAADGQVLAAFPAHPAGPVALAASRDGRFLITGGADRAARVWRADTAQLVAVLPHPAVVTAVAAADRGRFVTVADGTARVWDPPAGPDEAQTAFDIADARLWAQVHTGMARQPGGAVRMMDAQDWQQRRDEWAARH